MPKAQRTRGLSSYYKFLHKSWSNFIFRISNRYQLQNINQTSASRLILKSKIFTKPSIIQMHDCGNTSSTSNASLKRILPPVFMPFLSTLALLMHQVTLKDSRGVENTKTPKILDWVAWFSKKLWTWSSPLSPSGQNILQIFF